jgi:putative MATE family efflux protein
LQLVLENRYTYRKILKTAGPIILGSLAENIINVTDTAFVSRLGESSLGAVGMGSLYYYTFVLIAIGLAVGSQILIGRRNGEKDYPAAGALLDNSFYVFSSIAVILFLFLQFATPHLLKYIVHSEAIYTQCRDFVRIRSFGILFICLTVCFRAFYIGITRTTVIIFITAGMALVNVCFNYLLVFGKYGFPELGIRGSATASVISEGTALAGYIIYSVLNKKNARYRIFRFRIHNKDLTTSVLKVGFPLMLQSWVSVSSWFLFFLLIEKMGERALAVSTIIKNMYVLFMVPIWGFASTANTFVSNAMGAQRQFEVWIIIKRVLSLSVPVMVLIVQVNFWFPHWIISIYNTDPEVIAATIPPLWVVSFALIILSAAIVLFQSVSGTGATRISLAIELITLAAYLIFIFLTAYFYTAPLEVIWMSEWVYMFIIGVCSLIYLKLGKWKSIKI